MDRTTKATTPSEDSSPTFLNSLDFPPLTVQSRPDLNITPTRSNMSNITLLVTGSKKRQMKTEDEEISDEDSLSGSQSSRSASSLNSALSPVKKFRKLAYREPPPVLQSLDSDAFKTLLESPTLSDSQNSELGLCSSSWQSQRASTNNSFGESLGSLGDIIQKYTCTTLDSLKGFETLDSAISPTGCSDSLNLKQGDDAGICKDTLQSVNAATEFPVNVLSSNAAAGSLVQASFSHGESKVAVREESHKRKLNDKSTAEESQMKLDVRKENRDTNKNNNDNDYFDGDEQKEEDQHATNEFLESDLDQYQKCKKRRHHTKFYSIPDLQVKDLPDEIQHEDSVTFLSCLSQLVVQITVHSTSAARKPSDMYSSYIGTTRKRYGTGFIASVDDDIRKYKCRREGCPHATFCEDFNTSLDDSASMAPPPSFSRSESNASTSFNRSVSNISTASSSSTGSPGLKHFFYSGVTIHTNKHVIFDQSEAENAYVKFFYNTPQGKEVIQGHVAAISGINKSQDHVVLHVMSHERALFTTVSLCLHNAEACYKQMLESISSIQRPLDHKNKHDWVAIISHPHGMSKAISFGRIIKEIAEYARIIKYYDAATCPGSSGGLVITPSLLRLQWPGAVHSCTDLNTGYNVTFDSRSRDLDPNDTDRIHKTMISKKQVDQDIFRL
ncbi:unnamed protein product [Candidula unifasciata]|uniref:Uncharacterized protein n=1 Tax=Candidula unifasciata TaxID=100452 RepID=A0A8S3Z5H8_9EUPU|nr:unnamed protein product [Candidula unifasciata]